MLLNPIIGNQLILRQIHRLGFDAVAVLNGFSDTRWKGRCKALPLLIFQDFGLVFDHDASDVNIKYLARVKTDHRIVAGRQKTPVDRQGLNHIGIINLFQRGADAPRLTSGFFAGAPFITFSAIAKPI